MNEILLILAATGVFFGVVALRGYFGYLKNRKANSVIDFDKKKFIHGSIGIALRIASIGALAALALVLVQLAKVSGVEIAGLEQVSPKTLLVGILIADAVAMGAAIKEALGVVFGMSEAQINQIQSTASKLDKDSALGIKVGFDGSNVIASAETITSKAFREQLASEGLSIDHGEEVTPGKGSANTYPNPYRDAAPDTLVDPSTCYNRECVSYVAWKIAEAKGKWPPRTGDMNAKNWLQRLPSWGYKQVSAPREGGRYVGVLPTGTYGHVVWYEYGNTVSEYNYNYQHTFGMRAINLSAYTWFEIVAPAGNPTPAPTPTPKPAPAPQPAPTVPNNPSGGEIRVGDSVLAWGAGTADSYGEGGRTHDFPETTMRVIGINNGRYALNQYNQGTPGVVLDATGWWPASQVRKV